jgi:hypothetical protein
MDKILYVLFLLAAICLLLTPTPARAGFENLIFGYFCSRNGVEYVYIRSGQFLVVSYDQDGKPVRCKP